MSGKDARVTGGNRRDRLIRERVHDPYMTDLKLPEPTVCPQCRALFDAGRWQWAATPPEDASQTLCPACRRVREHVPAGFLTLSGAFFRAHRDEIMHLVQNKAQAEQSRHPMKRIMGVEEGEDGAVLVTFTDIHLPRGVGEAIERAYDGTLEINYTEGNEILRVYWQR